MGAVAPPQIRAKTIFFGQNRVKFGHFVDFSCIYFRAKMSPPPKLTELLRLWLVMFSIVTLANATVCPFA